MALSEYTIFEMNSAATASSVNAGGFNPNNANMVTDGTVDTNTGNTNSPVFSSATYTFIAGDVGHKLYLKSGTNCFANTWYTIASVSGGKATLSAAVGAAETYVNNRCTPSTVAGISSVGTPTSITFGIDYSRSTTAFYTNTDFGHVLASSILTSAGAAFSPVMVGNLIHLTTTGTGGFMVPGWYEIVSYTNATTVVIDRTASVSNNGVASTGYLGGAVNTGGTVDDDFFELIVSSTTGATRYFIKSGTYTPGEVISIAADGNAAWPAIIEGYETFRGDRPMGAARPLFALGANNMTINGTETFCYSMQFTSTGASGLSVGGNAAMLNCKSTNTSTTADQNAFSLTASGSTLWACEGVSLRGNAVNLAAANQHIMGGYFHHSNSGITLASGAAPSNIINNISALNVTYALNHVGVVTNSPVVIWGNTFYGAENKQGIGVNIATTSRIAKLWNNLIYGFDTGVSHADVNTRVFDDYNNYYNNTADVNDVTKWQKGSHDTALDPVFTSVTQRTGATATTTAGNHLVQSGATFQTWGVAAGDFVRIVSGTGVTVGIYPILTVDSETQITTSITLAADSTADKVWEITTGQNFAVGTNMKGIGFPGVFPGALTTGYLDAGAVQRQETGGSYAGTGGLQHLDSGFVRG